MAIKPPNYLSPDWWSQALLDAPRPRGYSEMMRAFREWEAQAGSNAHSALEKASASSGAASAAREKTLRAYNRKMHGGAARAIEAYDALLKARAAQYLKALEHYKAQVDAVDAAAAKTIDDANRMRKAMQAIRQSLDEATAMTEAAVAAQSETRVAEAMKLTETLERRTDAAIAIWESAMRDLNSVFLGGLAAAAARAADHALETIEPEPAPDPEPAPEPDPAPAEVKAKPKSKSGKKKKKAKKG
jgi:ABC-type transporter Mla subunit MlaD